MESKSMNMIQDILNTIFIILRSTHYLTEKKLGLMILNILIMNSITPRNILCPMAKK